MLFCFEINSKVVLLELFKFWLLLDALNGVIKVWFMHWSSISVIVIGRFKCGICIVGFAFLLMVSVLDGL